MTTRSQGAILALFLLGAPLISLSGDPLFAADVTVTGATGAVGANGYFDLNNPYTLSGAAGGAGQDATASATAAGATNTAIARGGIGGAGGNGIEYVHEGFFVIDGGGGAGGAAGLANATAITTAGSLSATAIARTNDMVGSGRGGEGGDSAGITLSGILSPIDGAGGAGSNATASATATNTSNLPVLVIAEARGGQGGFGGLGTNISPGSGGNGGTANLGTVFGSSTGGGAVTVQGTAIGGDGGGTPIVVISPILLFDPHFNSNGNTGAGAGVTLANKIDGDTSGVLTLVQSALGGNSGVGSLQNAPAGSATSTLNLTKSAAFFNAMTIAEGGDGGNYSSGGSGSATANTSITNLTGGASAVVQATGGNGADYQRVPQNGSAVVGGNATASGVATVSATTGAHNASLSVNARGGIGGGTSIGGVRAANGGAVSIPSATVANSSAGRADLSISATGGQGGNEAISEIPSNGQADGGAMTIGTVSATGAGGPVTVGINATGGAGGRGIVGGNGGSITVGGVNATGAGSAPVTVQIDLTGGRGGDTTAQQLRAPGGEVVLGPVNATSTGSGPVQIRANLSAGAAGISTFPDAAYREPEIADGGVLTGVSNGGAVDVAATYRGSDAGYFYEPRLFYTVNHALGRNTHISDCVNGSTTGPLTLSQTAIGGNGPGVVASQSSGVAGGNASSSLIIYNKNSSQLTMNVTAVGGNGGDAEQYYGGTGGIAEAYAQGANIGPITVNATALGGNGGRSLMGTPQDAGAFGGGNARASASSSGDNHPATARATVVFGQASPNAPFPDFGSLSRTSYSRAFTTGNSSDADALTIARASSDGAAGFSLPALASAEGNVSGANSMATATVDVARTDVSLAAVVQTRANGGDGGQAYSLLGAGLPIGSVYEIVEQLPTQLQLSSNLALSISLMQPPDAGATLVAGRPMLAAAGFGSAAFVGSGINLFQANQTTSYAPGREYSSSQSFTIPADKLTSPGHLQMGLFDSAITAAGVDSLHLTVSRDGATLFDRSFANGPAAAAFFRDRLIDLGPAGLSPTAPAVNVQVTLQGINHGAGDKFKQYFALANVAAPTPHLAVASIDAQQVGLIDTAGGTSVLADAGDGLFSPISVLHDASGNVLVSDVLASRIWQVNPAGQVQVLSGFAQGLASPLGLGSGSQGVLVADYLAGTVRHVEANGQTSLFAGAAQGVQRPFDVAVDSLGNAFIADLDGQRVIKIDAMGNSSVFADASDGLFSPIGLAIDANDHVYVSDVLTNAIVRFDSAGLATPFADFSDGLAGPAGMTFDQFGYLYVANYLGNNIARFDALGNGSLFAEYLHPFDVTSLGAGWGGAAARLAAVPEPSSVGLFALGAAILLWRGRQSHGRNAATKSRVGGGVR